MTNRFAERFLLWSLLFSILALAPQRCRADDWSISGKPWPEADQLFRRDSRWRGSDAANSIDLGGGRVLWTFGDSFIDNNEDPSQRSRKNAKFIRNSVAIQVGYDPTCAEFHSYWQEKEDGTPSSIFRAEGDEFYWPGGGLMVDDRLLVFLMRIRNSKASLGFTVVGWGAVLISNPDDDPSDWTMEFIATPPNSHGIVVGSGSSLLVGDWIYSYGANTSRRRKLFLTRLPAADACVGDFSRLQWWNGDGADWLTLEDSGGHTPRAIVDQGQVEFTVHYEPKLGSYLLTTFKSFPRSPIAVRRAKKLKGPWSAMLSAFEPEEADKSKKFLMTYAAKAHPEQVTDGLAVTYCTNTKQLASVWTDETLYYPRFVRFVFVNQVEEAAN